MTKCKYFRMMGTLHLTIHSKFFVNIHSDLVNITGTEQILFWHTVSLRKLITLQPQVIVTSQMF